MLLSLALMILIGFALKGLFEKMHLPGILGMLLAGSGWLILADHFSFAQVYLMMAATLLVGVVTTLLCREPALTRGTPRPFREAVVEPSGHLGDGVGRGDQRGLGRPERDDVAGKLFDGRDRAGRADPLGPDDHELRVLRAAGCGQCREGGEEG